MKEKPSKQEIFEMIARKKISSEEGFQLLKDIQVTHRDITGSKNGKEKEITTYREDIPGKIQQDLVQIAVSIRDINETDFDINKNLQAYGFDSASLTDLAIRINEMYDFEITPAIFFELDSPTVESLSRYLFREYQDGIERFYRESSQKGDLIDPESKPGPEPEPVEAHVNEPPLSMGAIPEPVAIIGMNGVMPRSENPDIFWNHLEAGHDLISEVPADRWDWKALFGDNSTARWGGFMKEVDKFDAEFFGISPREARLMDPQQRIFLEIVWKTIEDAGYKASDLSGTKTGLFVGVSNLDYQEILYSLATARDTHAATGTSHSMLANRISYLFNFHGPSEPIDTACSSSLVAVRRGVEAIRGKSCEMAIAGGINVILSPSSFMALNSGGVLSKDGRCKTFDRSADGLVRSEGAGAIFLKPLSKAKADRDHIYAVITGTAENHGGRAHSLTAPNTDAQAALLVEAYENARIDPSTVSYIEAHGTGTNLGDPVEINGLKKAFNELFKRRNKSSPKKPYCGIGSIKTNIGHLEAAAGIAGLIKILLSMKHKKIPANIHFKEINPYLQLEGSPFYIVKETIPWKCLADEKNQPVKRRAGVSSFGFGGSNAHIVLEEFQGNDTGLQSHSYPPGNTPRIIVLSAKNEARLIAYTKSMLKWLETFDTSITNSQKPGPGSRERTRADLLKQVSGMVQVSESDINCDEDLAEYGFDKFDLAALASELGKSYVPEITMKTFSQYPSINSLAQYLDGEESAPVKVNASSSPAISFSLTDIAYTLQTGRELMEERLAVVVSTTGALWEKLKRYCRGDTSIEDFYRSSIEDKTCKGSPEKENLPDESLKTALEKEDLNKIAQLFVSGVLIDWQLLYANENPKRVSLPTYPFEKVRHWVDAEPMKTFAHNREIEKIGKKQTQLKLKIKNTRAGNDFTANDKNKKSPETKLSLKIPAQASNKKIAAPPAENNVNLTGKSLMDSVLEILAKVLFIEPAKVDRNKAFMDLGLDSILAVEFARKLGETFHVNLQATKLYDYSNVTELTEYLEAQVGISNPALKTEMNEPLKIPVERKQQDTEFNAAMKTMNDGIASLKLRLKKILAKILFMEPTKIDENKAFMELGLDSILAVEFTGKLNTVFHANVQATQLYEYSTVNELAAYISSLSIKSEDTTPLALTGKKPATYSTDIAIIGISARFPGAENIAKYWDNLVNGVDSVTEAPPDRWDVKKYYDPDSTDPDKTYCKWGGFLQDIDKFDPLFFNISPAEAELLDPQQRLFLQEAWRALEDAGYSAEALNKKKCGIYVGVMSDGEYPSHSFLNARSILASRLSYFLNLKGPALCLDTACSSALVAMHLACKSLAAGETEMMLAGGVTLYLTENSFKGMSRMGEILSRDGKCKTFDNNADGFVPAEGAAVVVLKLLEKAYADGDHIYGVLKGSGINQDGKTNGITAPCAESQKELELEVYKNSGINPGTITYVEAHGTGTKLGDPIEINALTEAFRHYTTKKQYCPIGSVKTNIGHTSAAAGAAGVIKVLLAMKHQKIPPSLHFHEVNEHIDFKNSPFFVNTKLRDWNKPTAFPRRAAVSSFGYSGTNAHIVIEEPREPGNHAHQNSRPFHFIPLSARTGEVLKNKSDDLAHWLDRERDLPRIGNIAYTLHLGRSHFAVRSALVVSDLNDLTQKIGEIREHGTTKDYFIHNIKKSGNPPDVSLTQKGNRLIKELQSQDSPSLPDNDYKKKLLWLAHLYVKGHNLDWALFYQGQGFRRIPLPGYPFSKERYWFPTDRQQPSPPDEKHRQLKKISQTPGQVDDEYITRHIREDLVKFLSELLKIKETDIDIHGNMMEYGFDSITFMDYVKRINTTYDIEFTAESFFDLGNPTLNSLTGCLVDRFKDRFIRFFQESSTLPTSGMQEFEKHDSDVQQEAMIAEPIAVIGLSGIMPQADDLGSFWNHLTEGKNLVANIPGNRMESGIVSIGNDKTGSQNIYGGFLEEVYAFDAVFFEISPEEAKYMDPQQRIFLETAWKAIEDAGYKASELSGTGIGVFVGVSHSHYDSLVKEKIDGKKAWVRALNAPSLVANRVSYYLNLHGPSEAIDTAGSSSLTAVHRAFEALRCGACQMAIAGGVHVILNPDYIYNHDENPGMFGREAIEYAIGEGAGAVLLKPLKKAITHKDHIYAVIKGTTENHAVWNKSLLTPVNSDLANLLIHAHEKSSIDPGTITYVEAHGSTVDSDHRDSVEFNALKTAFALSGKRHSGKSSTGRIKDSSKPYCGIGTVKANTGNLETAAGIAGLIKVLLAMKYKKLPVNICEKEMKSRRNLENTPFYIVTGTRPWECLIDDAGQEIPRRAGVSSFGNGGTNIHVLLEESTGTNRQETVTGKGFFPPNLVILSARNEQRLKDYARKLIDFLETPGIESDIPQDPNANSKNLRQKIEEDILPIANETLKVNQGGYEPFGIHTFIHHINETFNLELTVEMFNKQSSIGTFIKYLTKNYKTQLSHYYNTLQTPGASVPLSRNLADIAYTLQIGREEMEERLATVVSTTRQLVEKLDAYCQGKSNIENVYIGNINNVKGQSLLLMEGDEKDEFLKSIIKKRKWSKLGYCWVTGVKVDWKLLYPDQCPTRISLPSYPFERKKYFVCDKSQPGKQNSDKST